MRGKHLIFASKYWVSFGVCLSIFRRKLAANGYSTVDVKASAHLPFVMLLAVPLQSAGIISLAFSGDYQLPFFISSGLMVAAMIIYKVGEMTGRTRFVEAVYKGEKSFDELFPRRPIEGNIVIERTLDPVFLEKVTTKGD